MKKDHETRETITVDREAFLDLYNAGMSALGVHDYLIRELAAIKGLPGTPLHILGEDILRDEIERGK